MRIWFGTAQKRSSFGGVYRSVSSLAAELSHRGHTVTQIWSSRGGRAAPVLFPVRLLLRLLLSVFRPPNWIIARSGDGLLCALANRLHLTRTKVALHSHGWEEKVYEVERRLPRPLVSNPTTWKALLFRFPLLRASLSLADICICGTVEEARFMQLRYPRHARKIAVVPNGVDHSPRPFWPGHGEWPPSFLLVGGFTWKKNIEYALDLFERLQAELSEARLFIVGTGAVPPASQKLIDRIGDAVFVVEREQPQKMFRWYESCPFLLSTSRYEGGRSLAILEAQNRGMVVFASAIPSTREIIQDGTNGVLLSGCDPSRDSARILEVCKDSDACSTIGTAAWKCAGRMGWDRQGEILEKLLLE